MAGDWIKMRVDLKEDPSVFKLAEILEVDELHIVGALFCFWSWADKHAVDGVVDGATSRLVDKVSCVNGFTDAMVQVGWIATTPNGIKIPNFDRHNGESAKERGLKNARQARWRANKDANVDGVASTNASTREEKRREDKSITNVIDKPEGVSDSVWQDFKKLRKAKKADVTVTAVLGIHREAMKAGLTLEQALAMCCERGWTGFKADWVKADQAKATGETAYQRSMRERFEEASGRKTSNIIDITPTRMEALS